VLQLVFKFLLDWRCGVGKSEQHAHPVAPSAYIDPNLRVLTMQIDISEDWNLVFFMNYFSWMYKIGIKIELFV